MLHGVACFVWFRFPQINAGSYGTVLFCTAFGLAAISLAFFDGPSGYQRPEPHGGRPVSAADFDHADRRCAMSLGGFLACIAVANAVLGLWLSGVLA